MKRLDGVSESESFKEAMKRQYAESKCLEQEIDRLKSIYENLKPVKSSSWRKPSKKINPTYPRISGATLDTAKKVMIRSRATFKRTAENINMATSFTAMGLWVPQTAISKEPEPVAAGNPRLRLPSEKGES